MWSRVAGFSVMSEGAAFLPEENYFFSLLHKFHLQGLTWHARIQYILQNYGAKLYCVAKVLYNLLYHNVYYDNHIEISILIRYADFVLRLATLVPRFGETLHRLIVYEKKKNYSKLCFFLKIVMTRNITG